MTDDKKIENFKQQIIDSLDLNIASFFSKRTAAIAKEMTIVEGRIEDLKVRKQTFDDLISDLDISEKNAKYLDNNASVFGKKATSVLKILSKEFLTRVKEKDRPLFTENLKIMIKGIERDEENYAMLLIEKKTVADYREEHFPTKKNQPLNKVININPKIEKIIKEKE